MERRNRSIAEYRARFAAGMETVTAAYASYLPSDLRRSSRNTPARNKAHPGVRADETPTAGTECDAPERGRVGRTNAEMLKIAGTLGLDNGRRDSSPLTEVGAMRQSNPVSSAKSLFPEPNPGKVRKKFRTPVGTIIPLVAMVWVELPAVDLERSAHMSAPRTHYRSFRLNRSST